jgi:hypothetical protein
MGKSDFSTAINYKASLEQWRKKSAYTSSVTYCSSWRSGNHKHGRNNAGKWGGGWKKAEEGKLTEEIVHEKCENRHLLKLTPGCERMTTLKMITNDHRRFLWVIMGLRSHLLTLDNKGSDRSRHTAPQLPDAGVTLPQGKGRRRRNKGPLFLSKKNSHLQIEGMLNIIFVCKIFWYLVAFSS